MKFVSSSFPRTYDRARTIGSNGGPVVNFHEWMLESRSPMIRNVIRLNQMIDADLERFASTGTLGPFDSTSTRSQIEQLLGAADAEGHPDFATYGHISFDLAGSSGPPCRIQIAFPHSSHMTPANPEWTDWKPPTCFDDWPDRRFHWNLGRFTPGLSLDAAIESLDDFDESEMISSTNGLRILHNAKSHVDLMFECDSNTGVVTLATMLAHPKPIAGSQTDAPESRSRA